MLVAALRTHLGFARIAALLLVIGPATPIRSGEDVAANPSGDVELSAIAADQVANEILQLRKSIGAAWRGEALAESSLTAADDRETIRTALVAQASSPVETPPHQSQPEFGIKRTLREAAHQLDLTAHTLECQELCSQADDVRSLAQRLRQQAREETSAVHPLGYEGYAPGGGAPAD